MVTKPWLWLSPEWAHRLSPAALRLHGWMMPYQTLSWGSFSWRGLEFTNPLGIAGGIDKDAVSIQDWWTLGPGFIEIGTITPRPQRGHTGRRLARHLEHRALWNRMGFPSQGVEAVIKRLKRLYQPRFTPVFANIGKNATTPIESAVDDYLTCLHLLNGLVDGFVINLSSPNTPGLRDLLSPDRLRGFLEPLIAGSRETHGKRASDRATPILLKLSPDVSPTHLEEIVLVAAQLGIDGFVVANSSTSLKDQFSFAQDGGVSGAPLAPLARDMLALTIKALGANRQGKLIISCGGVMTPQDVFERLSLGADLVQVYSALIFEGPFFFRKVANQAPERFQ